MTIAHCYIIVVMTTIILLLLRVLCKSKNKKKNKNNNEEKNCSVNFTLRVKAKDVGTSWPTRSHTHTNSITTTRIIFTKLCKKKKNAQHNGDYRVIHIRLAVFFYFCFVLVIFFVLFWFFFCFLLNPSHNTSVSSSKVVFCRVFYS